MGPSTVHQEGGLNTTEPEFQVFCCSVGHVHGSYYQHGQPTEVRAVNFVMTSVMSDLHAVTEGRCTPDTERCFCLLYSRVRCAICTFVCDIYLGMYESAEGRGVFLLHDCCACVTYIPIHVYTERRTNTLVALQPCCSMQRAHPHVCVCTSIHVRMQI